MQDAAIDALSRDEYFEHIRPTLFHIFPVPHTTLQHFSSILGNRDFKNVYKALENYKSKAEFELHFQSALSAFVSAAFMGNLHGKLGVYGLTLPNKSVIIDMPTNLDMTLASVYQISIMLHEFGHFLTRFKSQTVGEFRRITTPPCIGGNPGDREFNP